MSYITYNMIVASSIILLLLSSVLSKPSYVDHDDDEHQLFRAAFDTSTYELDDGEADDLQLGKKDIIKDGMWAIKAKLKELKAFNKALAANLLLTNMKVKELLENQIAIKKHQHDIPVKKDFFHKYQPQPYQFYELAI